MLNLQNAAASPARAAESAGASTGAGLLTLLRVGWQRHAQERSCTWSREQLERHQGKRLDALRRFVAARSPFYQRFHRGLERRPLAELPILSKATMMESFDSLVTDRNVRLADAERYLSEPAGPRLFRDKYVVLSTSGTTGRRGVFLFDDAEWIAAIAAITRPIAWSGAAPQPAQSAEVGADRVVHAVALLGADRQVPFRSYVPDTAS